MADKKSATTEVAEGIRSVLDRIGEFFHLFDLSFVVGGASTFGALTFLYLRMDTPRRFPFADWVAIAALVIAAYVCGLFSFAGGRWLNGSILFRRRTLQRILTVALDAHGFAGQAIDHYRDGGIKKLWRLYIRMWAEVAATQPDSVTFRHLMRYWVMSATYDALGFSFLIWSVIVQIAAYPSVSATPWSASLAFSVSGAFLAAAAIMFKRGADYYEYQIEDVVAALVVARGRL